MSMTFLAPSGVKGSAKILNNDLYNSTARSGSSAGMDVEDDSDKRVWLLSRVRKEL